MDIFKEKRLKKLFNDYTHNLHKQRLKDIRSKGSRRINNSVPKSSGFFFLHKSKEFIEKERGKQIDDANINLYSVCKEASEGKRKTTTQNILSQTKVKALKLTSLNKALREKEEKRIEKDNKVIYDRLTGASPQYSFSKLEGEWAIVCKYKKNISKTNRLATTNPVNCRLSPKGVLETPRLPIAEEIGISNN